MVVPSKLSTRVSVDHAKSSREKLRNLILLGLPAKERDAILKNLEFIELPTHFELHEAGEPIKFAYFIENGLASVLTMMVDGNQKSVGMLVADTGRCIGRFGSPFRLHLPMPHRNAALQALKSGSLARRGLSAFHFWWDSPRVRRASLCRYGAPRTASTLRIF
jgi:hypothetical protein